jgi:hypothetical protein
VFSKIESKKKYDPVTAPVPGVDQEYRQEILNEISCAGDPRQPALTPETTLVKRPTIIQRIKDTLA